MLPFVIACSAAKIHTDEPVQAWKLYQGELFLKSLAAAIRYSNEVYILSAGYGLLELNDLVLPYDEKMTPSRALWFQRNSVACLDNFDHLLPQVYLSGMLGIGNLKLTSPFLAIGEQMSEMLALINSSPVLLDLQTLRDGKTRTLLETGKIGQEYRTGGNLSICKFIGDLFENETLSIIEACLKCEIQFGPPVGLSYKPTVNRQLRIQAKKRNKDIQTYPIEGCRQLRFRYVNTGEVK